MHAAARWGIRTALLVATSAGVANYTLQTKSYDVTNAFAYGMKTELEEGNCERLASDPELHDRDTVFATHIISTRRDAFMGDTSEPVFSKRNYNEDRITTDGRFVAKGAGMGTIMGRGTPYVKLCRPVNCYSNGQIKEKEKARFLGL